MGKLRVLSGREVCEILEQHGFARVRQRGSHIVMQRVTPEGTITVPVPDHAELRIERFVRSSANRVCREVNSKREPREGPRR